MFHGPSYFIFAPYILKDQFSRIVSLGQNLMFLHRVVGQSFVFGFKHYMWDFNFQHTSRQLKELLVWCPNSYSIQGAEIFPKLEQTQHQYLFTGPENIYIHLQRN